MTRNQAQISRLINEAVADPDTRQEVWIQILSGDTRPILVIIRDIQLRHDFTNKYRDILDVLSNDPVSVGLVRFLYLFPCSDKMLLLRVLVDYAYSRNLV